MLDSIRKIVVMVCYVSSVLLCHLCLVFCCLNTIKSYCLVTDQKIVCFCDVIEINMTCL